MVCAFFRSTGSFPIVAAPLKITLLVREILACKGGSVPRPPVDWHVCNCIKRKPGRVEPLNGHTSMAGLTGHFVAN